MAEGRFPGVSHRLTFFRPIQTIVVGGSQVPVEITAPSGNARVSFNATAGQRASLITHNLTAGTSSNVYIYDPNMNEVATMFVPHPVFFGSPITSPAPATTASGESRPPAK